MPLVVDLLLGQSRDLPFVFWNEWFSSSAAGAAEGGYANAGAGGMAERGHRLIDDLPILPRFSAITRQMLGCELFDPGSLGPAHCPP